MRVNSRSVSSRRVAPSVESTVMIAALADQVLAGETVTAPSVEAAGALLDELKTRGRMRQTSTWRGNTLTISGGGTS